jgi:hypothetical protein
MRVLVACEFSGAVRRAFRARGHDAWSCDLLPAEDGDPHHYQADVFVTLAHTKPWDRLIAFPSCTYLTNSGVRWLKDNPERRELRNQAVDFVLRLMGQPIPGVSIENPIGHLSTAIRKPDQIIHPWQFGHGETKATCLWLKGLPKLVPTNVVPGREPRVHWMSPGADRWKERSRTYDGIAQAMADQWSQADVEFQLSA